MNSPTHRLYQFDKFRLVEAERQLTREGQPLPLTPKVFDLLLVLVQNSGRVLTKEELLKAVWPDSFVEEANLTQNISVLRRTLGEQADQAQLIETVPKLGYRFRAKVCELEAVAESLIAESQTQARLAVNQSETELESLTAPPVEVNEKSGRRPWPGLRLPSRFWALGMVGALLAVWLVAKSPTRPAGEFQPWRFADVAALKSQYGLTINGSRFSPDGTMIAFAAPGDEANIFIMQSNGSRSIRVTQGKGRDWSPVWSPDQQTLAFVSNRDQQLGIWQTPFLGGPLKLLKVLGDSTLDSQGGPPLLLAWSRDGSQLYYEWNRNVYSLGLASPPSEPRQLTHFDPKTHSVSQFALSPDEQWLAYVAEQQGQLDLWRLNLLGGAPQQITNDAAVDQHPLWHPGGQQLFYSSLHEGRMHIYEVALVGGAPVPLLTGDQNGLAADVALTAGSPFGLRILYQAQRDESDLATLALHADGTAGEEQALTADIGVEFWPSVAPDGRSLAFQFIAGERFFWLPEQGALLVKPLGVEPEPAAALEITRDAFALQWAPHGQSLAFLRREGSLLNLWTIGSNGGQPRQLTQGGVHFGGFTFGPTFNRMQTRDYSWTPDGSALVYSSKQGGSANVWSVTAAGARQRQLSFHTGAALRCYAPLWSPDGQQLAYVTDNGAQPAPAPQQWSLWLMGQPAPRWQTLAVLRLLGWSGQQELIAALVENNALNRAQPTEVQLVSLPLDQSVVRPLGTLPSAYFASVQLSPDGRNLSWISAQAGRDNLWMCGLASGCRPKQLTTNTDEKVYYSSLTWAPAGDALYFSKQTKWSLLKLIEQPH